MNKSGNSDSNVVIDPPREEVPAGTFSDLLLEVSLKEKGS